MDEKCVLLFPLAVASSEAGGAEEQGGDTSASNRSSHAVEELVLSGPEEDHTVLGLRGSNKWGGGMSVNSDN